MVSWILIFRPSVKNVRLLVPDSANMFPPKYQTFYQFPEKGVFFHYQSSLARLTKLYLCFEENNVAYLYFHIDFFLIWKIEYGWPGSTLYLWKFMYVPGTFFYFFILIKVYVCSVGITCNVNYL